MVVKASAIALREFPKANGAYRDGKFELYSRVNVGVAVAAKEALVVPTVFDAVSNPTRRVLLLSDVVMPDTHGPDLARDLRLDRPSLPVVFMSGYAESVLTARSALPPGAVLLDKPVSADQLLSTISRVLEAGDRIAAP